jgi:CRISPR-associated endonuclease/helicase Cas3
VAQQQPDLFAYWGKARPANDSGPQLHLLPFHSLDVAATGRVLLQHQPALLRWLSTLVGVDQAQMLDWLTFWLALHDLGKFATSFQNQRPDLLLQLQKRASPKTYTGARHDVLGALIWRRYLLAEADALGVGPQASRHHDRLAPWVNAVTGHHGQPPISLNTSPAQHFDPCDKAAAAAFVREMRGLTPPDGALAVITKLPSADANRVGRHCSWWVAGIAVLADWLGSNTAYFRYAADPCPLGDYWHNVALVQAERAIAASGVRPQAVAAGAHLQDIFTHERIPALTPLQAWADSHQVVPGPQLYLLEDVTGAGKTEAALTLAYRLMAAGQADGVFIGLPTMATANAMYDRVSAVAQRMFASGSQPSVVLAHGRRDLVPSFRQSVLPADNPERDGKQADETASARCAAWLGDNRKKALLASVGVGTIDQALLAVLNARHQSLRLLGLFRKVLIVDEVHACDAYMQQLLEGLLQFHAAAGGSAILVSATLTAEMKRRLARAFSSGCDWEVPDLTGEAFPLVTQMNAGGCVELPLGTRPDVQRQVDVDYVISRGELVARLRATVRAGGCACWIRNTVVDAIDAWEWLQKELPEAQVTLFHARFALGDRAAIERELIEAFGPRGGSRQRCGRVVVATQVVEQSLDLDFDLVVSDLAPIDRLIQRAGRQHRHRRLADGTPTVQPDERGSPRLVVHGPAWSDDPEPEWFSGFFPRGAAVYPHAGQLWLTARELVTRGAYAMPDDARDLIEGVFGGDAEYPAALQRRSSEAEGRDWAAVNVAFASRLKIGTGYERGFGGEWLADDAAPALGGEDGWELVVATRLGEATVTLRIARWVEGQIDPWYPDVEADVAWEMSSVRAIARHFKAPVIERSVAATFEATTQSLPDQGRWSILLPFARNDKGVWKTLATDLRGRERCWVYSETAGLREESAEEHTRPSSSDELVTPHYPPITRGER